MNRSNELAQNTGRTFTAKVVTMNARRRLLTRKRLNESTAERWQRSITQLEEGYRRIHATKLFLAQAKHA